MIRILLALLVLNVLVMIHEFGHFIVAKWTGVKVNEFAIGMGPRLLKWGKGETVYSIRLFPIGGFCAMQGEDEDAPTPAALGGNEKKEEEIDESRSFCNKKVWQRLLIVVAGALMNLLLGFALLLLYNGALLQPQPESGKVLFGTTTIARMEEESLPFQSGLRPLDTIVEVNGRRILMVTDLNMEMQNDADGLLQMKVLRPTANGEETVNLNAVQFEMRQNTQTGQRYLITDFILFGEERGFWNTITYSAKQEVSIATMVWRTLVDMVQGDYGLNDLSGPVGTVDIIADTVGEAVADTRSVEAWQTLVMLMTMITVNLGVFNLLPLPALDGGRILFLLWEGITRKPLPAKYEALVHFVGIVLLMLLMLAVTYSDITKLFA